ncbi:MAG: hypoxanthine phosphoribosyltransferase [Thermotogae bacterium]|nr:hypoxanthine phosphoribosyltransferase [Thermotogota bacterium]
MAAFRIDSEEISRRVREIAEAINADYAGKEILLVGVLKGAFIFMADLIRHISLPVEVDFLAVSSYGKHTESSGEVKLIKDLDQPIEGRHVLIVEDILDTGLTLSYIVRLLKDRNPASLRTVVLLDKPEKRRIPFEADYVGFVVPPVFLVGYGLDAAEKYRNLPYITEISAVEG